MSRISDKLLPMYIYVVFTIMYNYNFYICIQVTCNVVYTLVHACHLCKLEFRSLNVVNKSGSVTGDIMRMRQTRAYSHGRSIIWSSNLVEG